MTPLQKAAQELMDAIVQTDFTCRLGEQLDALEKALADEQAQAVKLMAWIERDMQCDDFDPGSVTCSTPVGTAEGWEWVPLYLHPAPPRAAPSTSQPVSMESAQAIIEEHLTGLYACTRVWEAWNIGTMSEDDFTPVFETDFAHDLAVDITAKLAAPSTSPAVTGERAELIARLRSTAFQEDEIKAHAREAADMLEADAAAYDQGRYDELQVQGPSQAEWAAMEAQQVAVPLTDEQIEAVCRFIEPSLDGPIAYDLLIARAIEARHGIGSKQDHKPDWSAA